MIKKDASLNSTMKTLQQYAEGFLIDYRIVPANSESEIIIPSELYEVLTSFTRVLEAPKDLPSSRRHDHAIHLKEGAEIPNIRPYP